MTYWLMFFLALAQTSWAKDTLIDVAAQARPAIVEITALDISLYKSPKAQAAIDTTTGKIIVAQKALTNYLEKTGAGVVIDPKGIVVANLHTVYQAPHIFVRLNTGEKFEAKLLTIMPHSDLVLLKITPAKALTSLSLADSDHLRLSDRVLHIGNSYLLKGTISEGQVVGLAEKSESGTIEFIKVNINLYKGDSGGAVLNENGELIGMIEGKFLGTDKQALLIPSNKIKKLYKSISN